MEKVTRNVNEYSKNLIKKLAFNQIKIIKYYFLERI